MRVLKWLWKQITEGAVYSDPEAYALVHNERKHHDPTER